MSQYPGKWVKEIIILGDPVETPKGTMIPTSREFRDDTYVCKEGEKEIRRIFLRDDIVGYLRKQFEMD